MLPKTLLLIASAALAVASPTRRGPDGPGCKPKPPKGAAPTLPASGGPTDLPNPPEGTILKHIALGHGIQNYSCAAASSAGVPVVPTAKGALAALYDATEFYPGQKPDSLSQTAFDALTTQVLWTQPLPLNLNPETAGRVQANALGADANNPFPEKADLVLPTLKPIKFLGHHFFDSAGVPNFVTEDGKLFLGNKTGSVPAPSSADKGPDATGAVAWLQLSALPGSKDITHIYRVTTAGGNGHACTAAGLDSVPYTAMYWMYGPKN